MPETHDSPEVELWLVRKRYARSQAFEKPQRLIYFPALFWHLQDYPEGVVEIGGQPKQPPLVETASVTEVEEPYRAGRGLIVRLWPTRRAVVVGYWKRPQEGVMRSETEALETALESHLLPTSVEEIASWGEPDAVTDDTEAMPDTVMVYDDQGRPLHREGSTYPMDPVQYGEAFRAATGLTQAVPYGPLTIPGDDPTQPPVHLPSPTIDFTKDDIVGWVGPDGWHPGPAAQHPEEEL